MDKKLRSLLWKWHFIGGIISLPFVFLLAVTGTIYLFKDNYEKPVKEKISQVNPKGSPLSFQKQWELVKSNWSKTPDAIVFNEDDHQATEFTSGRFSHKSSFYLNPYTGEETGQFIPSQTDMHKVRKLHGELLMGSFGTKIIELVASWMVVLILSGMYLFWPKEQGLKGLFHIRTNLGKRVFYRDLHGVLGFWFSGLLLLILAGGFPWTDVFGSNYKWIQKETNSGFPKTWSPHAFKSTPNGLSLTLDDFSQKAKELRLDGTVTIGLPRTPLGVFSISNQTTDFGKMSKYHFDRYSGELLSVSSWKDIGLMMKVRLWMMAFHQGKFGIWNFLIVLITALALCFMSISASISYLLKPKSNQFGVSYKSYQINKTLLLLIIILSVILPLFGFSLICIFTLKLLIKTIKNLYHNSLN